MIGFLKGILLEKQPPTLLMLVSGVGYEVDAPMSTFYALPDLNQEVALFTHLTVREDAHQLFGFYTQEERKLFRTLLKVNGIGPRLALTILSSTSPHDFAQMILNNDATNLVRIPGIGKKTAERLVIEMRDKLNEMTIAKNIEHVHDGGKTMSRKIVLQDAIAALVSLGYKYPDATKWVAKIDDGTSTSQDLIRRALKESFV